MLAPIPQQDAGHLDQPQVVRGLLIVAHQDGPALREPAQSSLHYPSPRRIAFLARIIFLLLADTPDVRDVAVTLEHFPSRLLVVSLVQAQVVRRLLGGFGALGDDGIERRLQEFEVWHVGSGYHHRKRATGGLDQDRAFDAYFGSIGRIGAYEVPPKRALPIAPSAACHSKSTPPNSWHSSIRASHISSSTPFSIHLWKVRCTEESSGNSLGSRFHWQPLLIRKMIASRAARWSTRGRPVLFGGSCKARIGSMISHNSSGTRQMVGSGFSWVEFSDIAGASLSVGITNDDSRS